MEELLHLVTRYGYLLVFSSIFVEHMGLPLPAVPILVGVGALSRTGEFSFGAVLVTALAGSLSADIIWYQLGRRYGRAVLNVMCRISFEPDYCVRRAEDAFVRFGVWSLLFAKFVPGLNAAAVPLAGMIRVPAFRFFLFDVTGLFLWAGTYASAGYIFSRQIELVVDRLSSVGGSLAGVVFAAASIYLAVKYFKRQRFLSSLRIARISADELKTKLDSGEAVLVLDLRNQLDIDFDRVRIPGAFHMLPDFADLGIPKIQRNREIIVYCSCPNEATSARVARKLLQAGLSAVRPLQGGLTAWRERGYPVESLD